MWKMKASAFRRPTGRLCSSHFTVEATLRESSIQGTSLGLYISRRLVEAHSGKLWVGDREDGRTGTRVTFTLPLVGGDPR